MQNLNVSKANGADNISNRLLKMTATQIAKPLSKLFKESLFQGKFPSMWKEAIVTPVFKKNDKQNKSNYRPISLLPNIGKVFERVIFIHLYKYCQDNNLLGRFRWPAVTRTRTGRKILISAVYFQSIWANNLHKWYNTTLYHSITLCGTSTEDKATGWWQLGHKLQVLRNL